jgi:hypothetical protein
LKRSTYGVLDPSRPMGTAEKESEKTALIRVNFKGTK